MISPAEPMLDSTGSGEAKLGIKLMMNMRGGKGRRWRKRDMEVPPTCAENLYRAGRDLKRSTVLMLCKVQILALCSLRGGLMVRIGNEPLSAAADLGTVWLKLRHAKHHAVAPLRACSK